MKDTFQPKFFTLLKEGIPLSQWKNDILAGVIVGIIALPLGIAFAIASGVSPERGLITAIIAGFTISLLGGSRVQIGGPTGAFIVIILEILHQYGLQGLILSTIMGGMILILMGLLKLGDYLKFIPHPLIVGFTSAIALIIFSSQMSDFFGLGLTEIPDGFLDKWHLYAGSIQSIHFPSFLIAIGSVLITIGTGKITKKIPGALVAIIVCSILAALFSLPVETIGSRFGELNFHIELPELETINMALLLHLLKPSIAIALLGAMESLLSAVVADGMIGSRHRSNTELIAQGTANILSGLAGGIPATGAIARTAANIRNGGKTPVAGIVHALTLLVIVLLLGPLVQWIPLSALAGILVVVAWNMSEWRQFRSILKGHSIDILILLVTFILTILVDLVTAIEVGIVLSSFLFMKRMSHSIEVEQITSSDEDDLFSSDLLKNQKIQLYQINGPLFFGAARQFQDALMNLDPKPSVIILRMRYVPMIDATGYLRLRNLLKDFTKAGIMTIISGVNENLKKDFEKHGVFELLVEERVCKEIGTAMTMAKQIISE